MQITANRISITAVIGSPDDQTANWFGQYVNQKIPMKFIGDDLRKLSELANHLHLLRPPPIQYRDKYFNEPTID